MTLYPTGIDIPKGYIWTVSEQDEKNCYVVYIDSDNVTIYHGYPKVNSASTVPMIAF
jgi:hypothetical protein